MKRQRHIIRACIPLRCAALVACIGAAMLIVSCTSNDDGQQEPAGNDTTPVSTSAERGPVSMTVQASDNDITVGEKLTLTIEVIADAGVFVQMPIVEESLGDFEVRRRSTPPDVPQQDRRVWRHLYVLDTFATGSVEIPALEVQYTDQHPQTVDEHGEPIEGMLTSEPLSVTVRSVLAVDVTDEDFRDIRGAVAVPVERSRMWVVVVVAIIVGTVAFAIAAGLLILLLRRRAAIARESVVALPPHQIALAELEQLAAEQLIEANRFHEFYYRLSDIVRQYIERQFGLMAPERTTEEFLRDAKRDARLSGAHRDLLADFLRSADMVKFARISPDPKQASAALDEARRFVRETAQVSMDAGTVSPSREPVGVAS